MFDLSELCVLLDLDHSGALSVFPEPDEVAAFLGDGRVVKSGETIVEADGLLRFRAGLNRIYASPRAALGSTFWRCALEIDGFPGIDGSIYKHLAEWMASYLDDTMKTREPKRASRRGYRRYRADGVIVDIALTPPSQVDSSERGQIELQITRDETRIATLRRILRVPDGVVLDGDPSGGTVVESAWDARMTACVVDAEVRVRWSAPMKAGGYNANDAARCAQWASGYLEHLFEHSSAAGDSTSRWTVPVPAGQPAEQVTLQRINDERRCTAELRFPARW